ncbi:MAG: methyltransferase domain-containing protein [Saprospiraceae bacterium]|nr:methyltransferase domain-containing protein [Saprospiraceae bacterium]MDP4999310.1 methyltransferase domain-containing protein [Saprospiraceae bacterium]
MSKFSQRSTQQELLDGDHLPFEDIRRNMEELDVINSALGGHRITLAGIRSLLRSVAPSSTPLHICEIGCGGGDNLRVVKQYLDRKGIPAVYTGIDLNPHCIAYAQSRKENAGITFVCSDYKNAVFASHPHILFSSLFCHHFTDEALWQQWQWMKEKSKLGFFVNDLHRHPLAYYSIRWLTQMFSKSYLVKNDAPLSVLRGFRRPELIALQQSVLPGKITLQWQWAFRWLLIYKHE